METKDQRIDCEIVHKASKGNTNADTVSRNPIPDDQHINNVSVKKTKKKKEKKKKLKEYMENEKCQIFYSQEYHDAPTGGHQGIACI